MLEVSTDYRPLTPSEAEAFAKQHGSAWMDERIPELQYELCVKQELLSWLAGSPIAPFDALIWCINQLPAALTQASVLEIGASAGYNGQVLKASEREFDYHAVDFAPAFQRLAAKLWPEVPFDIGDARALPYRVGQFDIVLSGSVILHVYEYEQAIAETARVASAYAIFHRTSVWNKPTTWFLKQGYGVPMLEARFNEPELLQLFADYGLPVIAAIDVVPEYDGIRNRSYVCKKGLFHHSV